MDPATTEPGRAFLRPPSAQAGLMDPATTEPGRAFLRPPSAQAGLMDPATTDPGRAFLMPPSPQTLPMDPATLNVRQPRIPLVLLLILPRVVPVLFGSELCTAL